VKNNDKRQLASLVKFEISIGRSMTATVKKLSKLGFKQGTISTYYKVFSQK